MEEQHVQAASLSGSMFDGKPLSRRAFLEKMAVAGGSLMLLAGCGIRIARVPGVSADEKIYAFITVDYTRCTGCRTCEAVCAAANHPLFRKGGFRSDLGNPIMANIRVHSFNPDASVPVVCARCSDTPCINACPVDPDPVTGRRALYQEPESGIIINDTERCIGCASCVETCAESSVGILARNPETDFPMRMCTLCDGNPQCVAHCPYEAMSVLLVNADYEFYRMPPEDIARQLNQRWYDLKT